MNHASLIDGVRLAKVEKTIFPHNGVSDLITTPTDLIITEALFSQNGDFVDQRALSAQAAFVLLDQAHSAGVFFEDGRGVKRDWSTTAMTVTFGKAFGVGGACILCSAQIRELLINSARPFIFSTAPPPVVPAMVMESLKIVAKESWRREALWAMSSQVRAVLSEVDPTLQNTDEWGQRSPIIPVRLGAADRALRLSENMRQSGFETRAIRYPTVKVGEERIRISLSLSVSEDNALGMAKYLVELWKEFL
ncbi:MAG: aminotransferase class I/II-fold pyridoxal phosphate-dependent enzyme [Deltaproteobacteria bacterium]|nr:aminotransferase class I/II-fold pyridoxal phosphate-dependent enzyme [Deltaproteobacteria bacterium]